MGDGGTMTPAADYIRMTDPGLTPRGLLCDAPTLRTLEEAHNDRVRHGVKNLRPTDEAR